MNISAPHEIGDLVYAIDFMESTETEGTPRKRFYTITNAVIYSITFYTSKTETEHTVLLATSEGNQWGTDIPLDWVSQDKQELINKITTLL